MQKTYSPRSGRNLKVVGADLLRLLAEGTRLAERASEGDPSSTALKQITSTLGNLANDSNRKKTMRMAVMALAKSGKSTLINAWLGGEFLPVANTPETARVVHISHNPTCPEGRLMEGNAVLAVGAEAVNCALRTMNHRFRTTNGVPGMGRLALELPIAALLDQAREEDGSSDIKFELIDTPGPNEAGLEGLKEQVHGLIKEADALVYVLDYTKLKTDSEADLFKVLGDLRPELRKKISSTLFFVVNKFEHVSRTCMDENDTRNYVQDILTRQLKVENLDSDRIHLISAEWGFLARMALLRKLSRSQREDVARIMFGQVTFEENLANVAASAPALMKASRLQAFEKSVLTHVFTNRLELFLEARVGRGLSELQKLKQEIFLTLRGLHSDAAKLGRESDQLEADLKGLLDQVDLFKGLKQELTSCFSKKMAWEFSTFFNDLRQSIIANINNPEYTQLFSEEVDLSEPNPGLQALSKKIAKILKDRVNGFTQHYLPKLGYEWHPEIQEKLAPVVDGISQQIEKAVGKRLRVPLVPIRLTFEPVDLKTMLAQVQEEILRLRKLSIAERTEHRLNKRPVKGLCCDSEEDYYMPINIEIRKYQVNQAEFQDYWIQRITEIAETSERVAQDRLGKEVNRNVHQAKLALQGYADDYVKNLRHTLKTHSKGLTALNQARATAQTILESCDLLLKEFADLQEYMEAR